MERMDADTTAILGDDTTRNPALEEKAGFRVSVPYSFLLSPVLQPWYKKADGGDDAVEGQAEVGEGFVAEPGHGEGGGEEGDGLHVKGAGEDAGLHDEDGGADERQDGGKGEHSHP